MYALALSADRTYVQGVKLVVRALRDLPPGTELSHCYGPQAGEHVTPLRRQLLQQQYHFHCMCAQT